MIFFHPFTCMLAGPSGSGKTELLFKILASNLLKPVPDKILYCYSRWQDRFINHPNIIFNEGLPDIDSFDTTEVNLIILDDLMSCVEKDKSILHLFTVDSHHKNISVFFLTQNLFSQGKFSRTISLNCHYMILLNNPRDKSQINYLSRQMFPHKSNFLVECYNDATSHEYGYLFLDFKQQTDNNMRVQSGILPTETRIVYQLKKI